MWLAGVKFLEDRRDQAFLSHLHFMDWRCLGHSNQGNSLFAGRSLHIVIDDMGGPDLADGKDLLELFRHGVHDFFRAVVSGAGCQRHSGRTKRLESAGNIRKSYGERRRRKRYEQQPC